MDTLFNISPDEPVRGKKSRARVARLEETPPEAIEPVLKRSIPAATILGVIDDHFDCGDGACGARCHDIIEEEQGEWRIECAFCGTGQWVKAIKGHLKPKPQEFVLRDGRFAGLTFAQVAVQPRGADYIQWAAADHPRQIVREAAKKHLDTLATTH